MSRISAKIKKALDPNNMANPTCYVNLEKVEIRDALKAVAAYP